MFSKATLAAIALASVSNAHMIMTTPIPYGVDSLNNSPLAADGSDFPCKQRTGVYEVTTQNTMALGSSQSLAFKGSATHGGGSCQVSITYDENPTADSTFKVIHSIIGGCPIKNVAGNNGDDADEVDPDTYPFTIPSTLPTGNATLAWTWFNKVGNREMYMNCAPVTLTSSSTKRDLVERDQAAFSALPDMFVANVGNGCGTADSADLVFPNPGDSVDFDGGSTSTATAAPTGSCVAATGSAVVASATATATGAVSAVTSAASAATSAVSATASAAVSGGVFATVATSASAVATTAVIVPTSATSAAAAASTGSSGALTGACTTDGMFNCIGGTSFQQCASGTWSVVQSVAAGTTCTSGQTMDLVIAKRGGIMRHLARRGLGREMFI
jgi:hypothetical protein